MNVCVVVDGAHVHEFLGVFPHEAVAREHVHRTGRGVGTREEDALRRYRVHRPGEHRRRTGHPGRNLGRRSRDTARRSVVDRRVGYVQGFERAPVLLVDRVRVHDRELLDAGSFFESQVVHGNSFAPDFASSHLSGSARLLCEDLAMRDPLIPPTMATTLRSPADPPFRESAPNVLVILCDDLGFAHLGSYGSDLLTPNLDRLAARGLRFTNFHTTAVCSPTRACLLTGRNHHRVGMGMLPDLPTNFPAYSGRMPRSAGTLAQILRADGYATFCVGKWHLVPRDQRVTGPYDMWPTGLGFDRYYGFLNGETNQWTPNLVRDTNHVEPPREPADGYHLDADLADNAIAYLRELRISHPRRPFLLWYASAAPHAPHQAPPEWIDRFRGQFDDGWDAWRDATLARQISLGIVPEGTRLSSRPPWIEEWSTIDAPRRRLYARMMEVCAAFIAHADHHIGRVLDHLATTGDLDNTVVVFVSDNGASGEGGPNGTYNQLGHYISDETDDITDELAHLHDLGGFRSSGHYPWGWALAGNTPFRRWKRYTFEGGVRDPFILAGPGIADAGGIRDQYCHAIDVLPTILDLCGLVLPDELEGVEQMSFDGTSLAPIVADATAPEVHAAQYYECWGSRAMYHDGWKAVTDHVNQLTAAERDQIAGSHEFATDTWALFDTRNDPTESRDLATQEPERLADLVAPLVRRRGTESGVPARRRRREPHHAHTRPVDRGPDKFPIPPRRQGPRSRRAEHRRRLPYGRNLRRAARNYDARGVVRTGRLDLGLGVVPHQR